MISSITTKTRPYIMERDRDSTESDQTIFHVKSKTVKEGSQTTANYAKAQIQKRRGSQSTEYDVGHLQKAEVEEWLRCVLKVERYLVVKDAPENANDHFALKTEAEPAKYTKRENGDIVVVSTEVEADLRFIFQSMDIADTEEVMEAAVKQSRLEETVKNA